MNLKCIIIKSMMMGCMIFALGNLSMIAVEATSNKEEIKDSIAQNADKLDGVNDNIDQLSDEQELIAEEIADLNAELINTLTSISLKEDEIALNQTKLDELMTEYDVLDAVVQKQVEEMQIRMQYMYENGNMSYIELLLTARSMSDFLNITEYVASIYDYDEKLLQQYTDNRATLEALKVDLEAEQTALENNIIAMESQNEQLLLLIESKKEVSDNFEAEIAKAEQEAAIYKQLIQQEEAELERIEAEEAAAAAAAAGSSSGNTSSSSGNVDPDDIVVTDFDISIIDKASGSELGKTIAKYACQFIGNPYVYGGTSLTNGADCSGFTYRVYRDFGYSLPRTSTDQRTVGTAVASLADAQPGDIICYSGHVAIYVGGGYIVHASSPETGIKIGEVEYKTILAIRRVV